MNTRPPDEPWDPARGSRPEADPAHPNASAGPGRERPEPGSHDLVLPPGTPPAIEPSSPANRSPSSRSGGVGQAAIGGGLGCVAYIGLFFLFLSQFTLSSTAAPLFWSCFTPPVVAGAIMLFFRRTRSLGIGVLIASAAAWLTVIGPCMSWIVVL